MKLSWNAQINRYLQKLWSKTPASPVALVGVGNESMGDDAAGMLVIQKLKASLPADSRLVPIEGGSAPENITGHIRKVEPGLVIFIDAGNMEKEPGLIGLFPCEKADGISAFGHSLPLSVIGRYLENEVGCRCMLLVIQPEQIGFQLPVSKSVEKAICEIHQGFLSLTENI